MILDRTTQASPNIAFRVWGRRGVTHKKTKVEDRAKNRIIEGHRFKDESSRKKTRHRNLEAKERFKRYTDSLPSDIILNDIIPSDIIPSDMV